MTNTAPRTKLEKYLADKKASDVVRDRSNKFNYEVTGALSGQKRHRFTSKTPTAALAAFGRFEVALATMIGENQKTASSLNLKQIANGLAHISANTNATPAPEFANAASVETIGVCEAVHQELKGIEARFETDLFKANSSILPDFKGNIEEVFAKDTNTRLGNAHRLAEKNGLRFRIINTGEFEYAHSHKNIETLNKQFDLSSAQATPVTSVHVFKTSANADHAPSQRSKIQPEVQQALAPHLRLVA